MSRVEHVERPVAPPPTGRDRDLWHVTIDDEHTALCGYRFANPESVPYGTGDGARCVVCEDLAAAFIRGEWDPAHDGAAS